MPSAALLALVVGAIDPALAQCAAIADGAARLACYDALAGRSADGTAVPATAAATPAAPAADFGLAKAPPKEDADTISAHIVGAFAGWQPGTKVTLDNGQVWKVSGEEHGFYTDIPDNAEVTVSLSHYGHYVLEIKAIGVKIRVKRVS